LWSGGGGDVGVFMSWAKAGDSAADIDRKLRTDLTG